MADLDSLSGAKVGIDCLNGGILRVATAADLPAINRVVEHALTIWRLSERVVRLALPALRYKPHDLNFMRIMAVTGRNDEPVGIAAWELSTAQGDQYPAHVLYLHGLYVLPSWQRRGVGRVLLDTAVEAARAMGARVVALQAWRSSESYFLAQGFVPERDTGVYPRRMLKHLDSTDHVTRVRC